MKTNGNLTCLLWSKNAAERSDKTGMIKYRYKFGWLKSEKENISSDNLPSNTGSNDK